MEHAISLYRRNKKGDLEIAKQLRIELPKWESQYEKLYTDSEDCLKRLSRNYEIGIIANQPLGTSERLENLGVRKYIDLVIASAEEGDLVTSIVNGKDCVFTCYDEKGYCYCAIEKAYREGKCNFYKPISCHLYPIRIGDYGPYKAVNYHRWDVCKAAVLLGKKENLPVYKFLKEPLIRKFGNEWYQELENVAKELEAQHLI